MMSGPPMLPRPHEAPPTAAPPPARQPGVMDTAPIRGGDPAAMLAAGGGHEAVCEGMEHLSPPGDDELATLRRLGLEGRAGLACRCNVSGPVLIDREQRVLHLHGGKQLPCDRLVIATGARSTPPDAA